MGERDGLWLFDVFWAMCRLVRGGLGGRIRGFGFFCI